VRSCLRELSHPLERRRPQHHRRRITRELAKLVTDLSNLHGILWHWYRNGVKPQTVRLPKTAGADIVKMTQKFVRSLP
jgi:hypothetical protein